jgi:hypothetical protein
LSGYIVSHVILEEMFPADIYEDWVSLLVTC